MCVSINHQLVRVIICHPLKLESPNLDQKCKTTWLRSLLFASIDLDFQGEIKLKSQNFIMHGLSTREPWDSFIYLDCFMVPTVSQSPSSARAYLPRPLDGPNCFTVSTLCTFTDLGNQGYFQYVLILPMISTFLIYSYSGTSFLRVVFNVKWMRSKTRKLLKGSWLRE